MALPNTSDLVERAKEIVLAAGRKGELNTLTHRIVRQEIEMQLSLGKGILDAPEYKKPLKIAITEAVEEARHRKQTSSGAVSPLPLQKDEKKGVSPKEEAVTKRGGKGKGGAKEDAEKKHKSAEYVVSDAESGDGGATSSGKATLALEKPALLDAEEGDEKAKMPGNASPDRKKGTAPSRKSGKGRSKVSDKPTSARKKRVEIPERDGESSETKIERLESKAVDEKSDTELSDLIDEPPKKKKESKSQSKSATRETAKRKKSTEPPSKDEETIKRLKSLIVACGVRKVWSKVFQGLGKPSEQIGKLKEILSELGMTGRLSMEQAKVIREKRELAQELEDVQKFERAVAEKGSKKRSSPERESEAEDDENENESDDPKPKRRKVNARQSIMAFLQDQSESE